VIIILVQCVSITILVNIIRCIIMMASLFCFDASSIRVPNSYEDILPGGSAALIVLFSVAVVLALWH
jgi:hypothetical protein